MWETTLELNMDVVREHGLWGQRGLSERMADSRQQLSDAVKVRVPYVVMPHTVIRADDRWNQM